MKISEIDKALALDVTTSDENTVFMDVRSEPFCIFGVLPADENEAYYRRMPQTLADRVSKGVADLNHHTAGGHVRFRTDYRSERCMPDEPYDRVRYWRF